MALRIFKNVGTKTVDYLIGGIKKKLDISMLSMKHFIVNNKL